MYAITAAALETNGINGCHGLVIPVPMSGRQDAGIRFVTALLPMCFRGSA